MGHESVKFNGAWISIIGVISGVAIAVGVPYMALSVGQFLGPTVVTIIVLTALVVGGGVALVAAFFGTVIPRTVEERKGDSGIHKAAAPAEVVSIDKPRN
jgi:hypothetical protein